MGFSVTGYIVDKPRVGTSNSPFTLTPDNIVSDPGAFSAAFPSNESASRAEYMTLVLADGDLAEAEFGWTRNDEVQRFYWEGRDQRYRTLPGSTRSTVGVLALDANTTRLKVPAPGAPFGASPVRLSAGEAGIGSDFTVQTVLDNSLFGSPGAGSVEISLATGEINWNMSDLTAFEGETIFFQRQQFFTTKESTGNLGVIPPSGQPTLLLNPMPATGQSPLVRIGFGLWLSSVEVVTHSSNPTRGTVEWQRGTGLLKFNSADLAANQGAVVYYDGALLARGIRLPQQALGTVTSPTAITAIPAPGGDLIFRATTNLLTGSATFSASNVLNSTGLGSVRSEDVVILTSGPYSGTRRRVISGTSTSLTVAIPFPSYGACTFSVQRKALQFGETLRYPTLSGHPVPSSGQVAVDDTGAVATSAADKSTYGSTPFSVVIGDLPIENGISLRLFRTPVDLQAQDPTLKDVSAFYFVADATLMDPLVGTPFVALPAIPIDDAAFPLTVKVEQGTGTYPPGTIPRLDVGTPAPASAGYGIDFEQRRLNLAARRNNVLISMPTPTGATQLPDPLVDPDNALLELDSGSGYSPLVVGEDVLFDATSGLVRFIGQTGSSIAFGTASTFTGANFVDSEQDFTAAGVQPGDLLLLPNGPATGVYQVLTVSTTTLTVSPPTAVSTTNVAYEIRRGAEVLADRYFGEVSLIDPTFKVVKIRRTTTTPASNSPRQSLSTVNLDRSGIRFGGTTFATVSFVALDSDFGAPPAGTVEVSRDTGHLNFSSSDLGSSWFWVQELVQKKDFRFEPTSGFIQVVDRLLANDELQVTYRPYATDSTTEPGDSVTERATFLVRKELGVYIPPSQTSFNKFGKTVATSPAPAVFRGGRPQDLSQVSIDTTTALVTFLPDNQITEALPHGSNLKSTERVTVDYYVYEAIGGENTTIIKQPPMYVVSSLSLTLSGTETAGILEGNDAFFVPGDKTSVFAQDYLLRVGSEELYYLAAPTYDSITDRTKVQLLAPQLFRTQVANPQLFLSSGPTRRMGIGSYFVIEPMFDRVQGASSFPRGMNTLVLPGDRSSVYQRGTVIYLSAPGSPATQDFYLVQASLYDATTSRTTITIATTLARQYNPSPDLDGATMRRSIRPIFEATTDTVQTSKSAALEQGYVVYRQVEGEVGEILAFVAPGETPASSDTFKIDASGRITFKDPLSPKESFNILYTGYTFFTGTLRASYTHTIVPNSVNGLENQRLLADYSTYAPDTFFYRVETLTNYRGEITQKYKDEAKANVPSGGPITSNASSTPLYKQGSASVFFEEGQLSNEDIVARSILKFYNDAVNYLEDTLRAVDGRVIGDKDGRFKFDGSISNAIRTDVSQVTNEIDDVLRVSPFPLPNGTTQPIYIAGPYSRFYPTRRNLFAGPTLAGSQDGDPIAKFAFGNISSVPGEARRRSPRAQVLRLAPPGTTTFYVDNATGTTDALLRPAFQVGMRVIVKDSVGMTYIDDAAEVIVTAVGAGSPETVSLSAGSSSTIPPGATIYLSPSDASTILSNGDQSGYAMVYRFGKDIDVNKETGELLFIERVFPFDGSLPELFIPKSLLINEVPAGDILQCNGAGMFNVETSPYKFPALYGGTLDDDGDQSLPIVGPAFDGELTVAGGGPLNDELTSIQSGTGLLRTVPTQPLVGTGSLDASRTVLTSSTNFPSPVPKVHDLVRILSGLNGSTSFRRITAVTASTVTVESAFATQDSGFTYTIAVSSLTMTGTGTTSSAGIVLTDTFGTFTSGAQPGYTVVLTSGADVGCRRQIQSVDSATQIHLNQAFPTSIQTATYRVDRSLATYSGPGASSLTTALTNEASAIGTRQQAGLAGFFNTVFTTVLSGTTGVVTIGSLSVLTDTSVNFMTGGVVAGQYLYIPAGSELGVYRIASVDSATQVTLEKPLPVAATGITYQMVTAFGAGLQTFEDLSSILRSNETFLAATTSFASLVNTNISVFKAGVADATVCTFARGYLPTDFDTRVPVVQARLSYLTDVALGPTVKIGTALLGSERLYDKRYSWIDARIALEKGILPKRQRAHDSRIKTQADTVNQLIKLLSLQG